MMRNKISGIFLFTGIMAFFLWSCGGVEESQLIGQWKVKKVDNDIKRGIKKQFDLSVEKEDIYFDMKPDRKVEMCFKYKDPTENWCESGKWSLEDGLVHFYFDDDFDVGFLIIDIGDDYIEGELTMKVNDKVLFDDEEMHVKREKK